MNFLNTKIIISDTKEINLLIKIMNFFNPKIIISKTKEINIANVSKIGLKISTIAISNSLFNIISIINYIN